MSTTPPPPTSPASKASVNPKTPSQRRPGGQADKGTPKQNDASPEKKGHQRRGSSSRGGAATTSSPAQDRRSSPAGAKAAAIPAQGTTDGLANLKNIISELKEAPSPSSNAAGSGGNSSGGSASHSPSRQRQSPHHQRKSSAGSQQMALPSFVVPPQQSGHPSSGLNPAAGGFQPGSLGPITDRLDEGLITPTATHFDLMTGMPSSPPGLANLRQQADNFGGAGAQRGVVGGFVNPQQQQSLSQQQHYLQLQQQQQAFQIQQMANIGAFGGSPGSNNQPRDEAAELMAEQLAIQQQLASLRVQQENLLARFGDMQANAAAGSSPESQAQPAANNTTPTRQHRRVNSQQQIGGAMGQFGIGGGAMGSFGAGVGGAGAAPAASGVQKGHGRRKSVNTSKGGSTSIGSLNQAFSFGAGSSASTTVNSGGAGQHSQSGSFSFPGAAGAAGALGQAVHINDGGDFGGSGGEDGSGRRGMGHQRRQSGSLSSLGGWQAVMSESNRQLGKYGIMLIRRLFTGQGVQANLAEAQSHLQQLGAYRASAGHARVPSFGMSTLGGGPGQLAMAGYGGGLPTLGQGGAAGGQQRKSLFAPYLPQASIPPLIAAGKLVVGTLRVVSCRDLPERGHS